MLKRKVRDKPKHGVGGRYDTCRIISAFAHSGFILED